MKSFIKVILMILLYLFIGVAVFALITYFKDIKILSDINKQLYFGAGSVALAIIDLILLWGKEDKDEEDVDEVDTEVDETSSDELNVNDQQLKQEFDQLKQEVTQLKQEQQSVEEDIVDESNAEQSDQDINEHDETEEVVEDDQEVVLQKANDDTLYDVSNDEKDQQEQMNQAQLEIAEEVEKLTDSEEDENEDYQDAFDQQEELSEDQEEINPLPQKINADLTDTQIMFINKSDNSYINDQGLPQLNVTKELSQDKIKTYEKIYQKQQEIDEETQKQLDEEEQQYLLEEKYENTIHILTVVIILLVLANLVFGAYYAYLRLF